MIIVSDYYIFRRFVTEQETATTVVVDIVLVVGQALSEQAPLK